MAGNTQALTVICIQDGHSYSIRCQDDWLPEGIPQEAKEGLSHFNDVILNDGDGDGDAVLRG